MSEILRWTSGCNATGFSGTMPEQISSNMAQQLHEALCKKSASWVQKPASTQLQWWE